MKQFKKILYSLLIISFACTCSAHVDAFQPYVSKQTAQLVRTILRPHGYHNLFSYMVNFSSKQLQENPYAMIAVAGSKSDGYYLLINEPWFTSLTSNVQQFVIMHEVMHIQLGHLEDNSVKESENKAESRHQELDADYHAVQLLRSSQGALAFFDTMKKYPVLDTTPSWQERTDFAKQFSLPRP